MKRIFLLFTALSAALCLCACDTQSPEDTTAPTETEPTTKTVYLHSSVTQEHGATSNRTEYVYNDEDLLTHIVIYANDEEVDRYTVETDENGNAIRWTNGETTMQCSYDDRGHPLGTAVSMNGNAVSATTYQWEGDLRVAIVSTGEGFESRHTFTYDEAGHLIRQDIYVGGELTGYTICTNDDSGKILKASSYLPDGSASTIITYDYGDGTQTRTTTLPDGTVTQKIVMTYDENGNLATSVTYDGEGEILSKDIHVWRAVTVPIDCPRAPI